MLEKKIGVPVVAISAQKQENIDRLMDVCYNESKKYRNGVSLLNDGPFTILLDSDEIVR